MHDLRLAGVRLLNYVTNHVIAHLPVYRVRHGWYRRVLGISLAPSASVQLGCYIWFYGPGHLRRSGLTIGPNTRINRNCCLDARGALSIGANVSISPNVSLITAQHKYAAPGFALESRPVRVDDYAWIGMGATVLPGAVIGRGAVVAAGAVVSGRVPPMTVVAGIPARAVATRPDDALAYLLDEPLPLFE